MHSCKADIRFGILGAGRMAGAFAKSFTYVKDASLAAVASRSLEKSKAFAKEFHIPKAYGSYADLVTSGDVDVVYIATPLTLHKEHALLCLENNVAILCEKPFTTNEADAREIVDLARKKGLFAMEALWSRFVPSIRTAHELIKSGVLGDLYLMTGDFGIRVAFNPEDRLFNASLGGGALFDLGIYPISLAYYLMGHPTLAKAVATVGSTRVDENVVVALTYDSVQMAILTASLRANTRLAVSVYGSKGALHINPPIYAPRSLTLERYALNYGDLPFPLQTFAKATSNKRAIALAETLARRLPARINPFVERMIFPFPGSGYQFEIEDVVNCMKRGALESTIMPLDETVAIYRMMDGLRQQVGQSFNDDIKMAAIR